MGFAEASVSWMQGVHLIQISPGNLRSENEIELHPPLKALMSLWEISDVYLCQRNYACSTRDARDSEGDRVTRATEIGVGVDFIYFCFRIFWHSANMLVII